MENLTIEEINRLVLAAYTATPPPGSQLIKVKMTQAVEPYFDRKHLSNIVESKGRRFQKRSFLVHKIELVEEYWEIP